MGHSSRSRRLRRRDPPLAPVGKGSATVVLFRAIATHQPGNDSHPPSEAVERWSAGTERSDGRNFVPVGGAQPPVLLSTRDAGSAQIAEYEFLLV
jgi:hypothetical protein